MKAIATVRLRIPALLLALLLLSLAPALSEEKVSPFDTAAVKVSELTDGMEVYIVNAAYGQALTPERKDKGLATAETYERDGYLYTLASAALWRAEIQSDGTYAFSSGEKYLSAEESGRLVLKEYGTGALWRLTFRTNGCTVESAYLTGSALEYYPLSDAVVLYKTAQNESFRYAFYAPLDKDEAAKLTDALPERKSGEEKDEYALTLFETTDLHGYLADTSAARSENYTYPLAAIAARVREARLVHGEENVLLLDGGDMFQGSAVSNEVDGQSVMAALDIMKYDAVALGNHEFDWGVRKVIDPDATLGSYDVFGLSGNSKIPVLCMNISQSGEPSDIAVPFAIIEKTAFSQSGEARTVNIGVIGWAEDYGSSISKDVFSGEGYSIREDYRALEALASALKADGCDAVIVLAHMDAAVLAHKLRIDSDVDLVLGGHSHFPECGVSGSGIPYMQAYCYGRGYCEARLVLGNGYARVDGARFVYLSKDDTLCPDGEAGDKFDPEVLNVALEAASYVRETVGGALAIIDTELTLSPIDGCAMSCTLGNFMLELVRAGAGVDVAFTNMGALRTGILLNGAASREVSAADIYTAYPFDNDLCVYEISYGELLGLLDATLNGGAGARLTMSGIDCYYSGTNVTRLVSAGGEVIYDRGVWAEGWQESTLTVSVNAYVSDFGSLPFSKWKKEGREMTLGTEKYIIVAALEAYGAGGIYPVDTRPHLINEDAQAK